MTYLAGIYPKYPPSNSSLSESRESLLKISREYKFHLHNNDQVHELNGNRPARRMQFCEKMSQHLVEDLDLIQV